MQRNRTTVYYCRTMRFIYAASVAGKMDKECRYTEVVLMLWLIGMNIPELLTVVVTRCPKHLIHLNVSHVSMSLLLIHSRLLCLHLKG